VRPKFSIITPSFRQLDWLKLCAASIADQENVEAEHIVQDAGTGADLEAWSATQSRLKLFVEKDNGMYDAVNRGLRRASGDILAYLNCDEQYLPGTLAQVADFFAAHPKVDVVFGNAIVANADGQYLCSREVLLPQLYHAWTCTLPVFTAATFFRRSILDERRIFFPDDWRVVGDAVWILELLRKKIPMAVLGKFTTVFTETGDNLGATASATQEIERLKNSAPLWAQKLKPLWIAQHRIRRLLHGIYWPKKMSYSIFTHASPARRKIFVVDKPTSIWWGRLETKPAINQGSQ